MDTELYTLLDDPVASAPARREVAFSAIKRQLLDGAFPLGARLAEERLAAELEMSRTPVREALQRLAADGLVERHPEGGYRPVVPKLEPVRELYEVRRALEREALRRPLTTGIPHDLALVEPLLEHWRALAEESPGPDPSFVVHDEDFHVTLARAAGNESLVGFITAVNDRIRLVRMYDFLSAERMEATVHDHIAIAEAVLAGDLEAATAAFDEHLGRSLEVVVERVESTLARMAAALGGPR